MPDELGSLHELATLRLRDNRLTGRMPYSLCGLNGLIKLEIRGNNWTDCIPGALFDVPENDLVEINLPVCATPYPISLRDVLDSGTGRRLPLSRSVDICRQVALALKDAHDRGLMRGDVKPENILIGAEGTVELSGFGTARAEDLTDSASQERRGRAGVRADMRSLGAALCEMLTGRTPRDAQREAPFDGGGEMLKALRPEAPAALRRVVDKCLADSPEGRFQTADELLQEIASPDLINRCALIDFYEAAGGPKWKRSDNWLTDKPLDDWRGVTAGGDGVVTGLELGGGGGGGYTANKLRGEIPREIAYLSELESLDLSCNYRLYGFIPPEIGGLTKLRRLDLSLNSLSRSLPPEIGGLTKLETLDLSNNELSGSLPPELGCLAELKTLDLSHNKLSGSLPPEIGRLTKLKKLNLGYNRDLDHNGLSGSVPPELGDLTKLKTLTLHGNALSGSLPPELGDLTKLKTLDLHDNSLSGSAPPELGGLAELKKLDLSGNRLSGSLPPELGGLAKLKTLDLSHNRLSGGLPPELGGLTKLKTLYLHDNSLSGSVPPELGGLAKLKTLDLSDNRLSGVLPPELGSLTKLEMLRPGGNRFSGSLPPGLRKRRFLFFVRRDGEGEISMYRGENPNEIEWVSP